MKKTSISALIVLTALAACATKTASIQQEPPYTGPTITLHRAPGAAAASAPGTVTAISYFNARRAEVGLPAIAVDPGIAQAAADHARYLDLNHVGTHDETQGKPGFTGVDIMTRVKLHTSANGVSEVLAVFNSARDTDTPATIFDSPYHRGAVFYDWAHAGEASLVGSSVVTVVDFADTALTLTDTELVAWPYDGQRDAPTSWVDNEQPDPMGADGRYRGQTLGYPLTLSGGPNAHIVLQSFELRDQHGRKVPCVIAPLTAADSARNTAICTPYEPLAAGVRYTVHARGKLTQYSGTAPFDLVWGFATAGPLKRPASVVATVFELRGSRSTPADSFRGLTLQWIWYPR
jgi:uncharacterized protein YkwD